MTTSKNLFCVVLIFTLAFTPASFGEGRTFTKDYARRASDAGSKTTSRAMVIYQAKRLLVEEKGADYAG
jgi:hypothetical protein